MAASMSIATSARVSELLAELTSPRRETSSQSESVKDRTKSCGSGVQSRPLNKALFWDRVATFKTLTWFGKPESLSPIQCARFGWENVTYDTLQCVSCKAFITGRMPQSTQPAVYEKCLQKLEASLKTGHHISCPWTNNPSPEEFQSILPERREESVQHFRERFRQFCSLDSTLPNLGPDLISEELNLTEENLQSLINLCDPGAQSASQEVQHISAALTLTGWKCSESKAQMLQCDVCQREVGLWNFVSHEEEPSEDEEEEEGGEEPSRKRIRNESGESGVGSDDSKQDSNERLTPVTSDQEPPGSGDNNSDTNEIYCQDEGKEGQLEDGKEEDEELNLTMNESGESDMDSNYAENEQDSDDSDDSNRLNTAASEQQAQLDGDNDSKADSVDRQDDDEEQSLEDEEEHEKWRESDIDSNDSLNERDSNELDRLDAITSDQQPPEGVDNDSYTDETERQHSGGEEASEDEGGEIEEKSGESDVDSSQNEQYTSNEQLQNDGEDYSDTDMIERQDTKETTGDTNDSVSDIFGSQSDTNVENLADPNTEDESDLNSTVKDTPQSCEDETEISKNTSEPEESKDYPESDGNSQLADAESELAKTDAKIADSETLADTETDSKMTDNETDSKLATTETDSAERYAKVVDNEADLNMAEAETDSKMAETETDSEMADTEADSKETNTESITANTENESKMEDNESDVKMAVTDADSKMAVTDADSKMADSETDSKMGHSETDSKMAVAEPDSKMAVAETEIGAGDASDSNKEKKETVEENTEVSQAVEATELTGMEEESEECVTALEATADPEIQTDCEMSEEVRSDEKETDSEIVTENPEDAVDSVPEVEQGVEVTEDLTEVALEATEDIVDSQMDTSVNQTETPVENQDNTDSVPSESPVDVPAEESSNTANVENENPEAAVESTDSQMQGEISPKEESSPPSRKRIRKRRRGFFHPLREHQRWCPWVQSCVCGFETEGKTDWKRLYDILTQCTPKKKTYLQNSNSPAETIMFIRHLFDDWTSP